MLARRAAASAEFAVARRIGLYAELPDEMPMQPLYEAIRAAGKTAFLPRVPAGLPQALRYHPVEAWEDLVSGRYGVRQPEVDPAGGLDVSLLDLVVVPGLLFDRAGRRLGRGGGYYDRTLGVGRPSCCLGAAFSWQVVDRVPAGPLDQPMDAVVTEREWIQTLPQAPQATHRADGDDV